MKDLLDEIEEVYIQEATPENPVSSAEIRKRFIEGDSEGRPNTRAIIKRLITTRGLPLVAGGDGYFVAQKPEHIFQYLRTILSRNKENLDRLSKVVENFTQGQRKMEFEEGF